MSDYCYEVNKQRYEVSIQKIGDNEWQARLNDRTFKIHLDDRQSTRLDVRINGRGYHCHIDSQDEDRFISWKGSTYTLKKVDLNSNRDETLHSEIEISFDPNLKAPMPGRVVKMLVNEGDQVEPKQPLLVLEAMKMEFVILAPCQSYISKIYCNEGDRVDLGVTLISLTLDVENAQVS